jgi:hypothetical protein
MQDLVGLTRKIAELCANDEDRPEDGWRIELAYMDITVSAVTREHYRNETEAWKGAQRLRKVVLDHGFTLRDDSRNELGVIQGPGPGNTWNAKIHVLLDQIPYP